MTEVSSKGGIIAKELPMQPRPLFIYGTLCAKELLAWALTGEATNVNSIEPLICPARVYGFARYRLHHRDYPAAVACGDSSIDGYLITFQNTSQRQKLDDFEGEIYNAVATTAYTKGSCDQPHEKKVHEQGIEADIYLWNGPEENLLKDAWDLQEFIDERLEDWLDLFQGMELTGGC